MSPYIVDRETIDIIATAATQFANVPTEHRRAAATAMGRLLWAANLRSVATRYPADVSGQRPGPIGWSDDEVGRYSWEDRGPVDPSDVIEAVQSLDYQCSEIDGWDQSNAHEVLRALYAGAEVRAAELVEAERAARATVPRVTHDDNETGKAMRVALRAAFPGVKFSVRQSGGSMCYGHFDVRWTDGPTIRQVQEVTAGFHSSRFNGMTDGYDQISETLYMVDGVPTVIVWSGRIINEERHYSAESFAWADENGPAMPEWVACGPWESRGDQRYRVLAMTDLGAVGL